MMILIDTCGWIEWLTNGKLSGRYENYFDQFELMIVPTSVQFELYKWVARVYGVQHALESIALTEQASVIPLSTSIALSAADYSAEYKLSFADAIIYATARFENSSLITSDDHFKGLPDVTYYAKTVG
ncbi:MAG: type II toxin-antitoxin system VapC family toxin [Gammaproteobacteria bacterium]|nr:type II toxin-antitoxin system VapC family toxin [Gammaproteobacteria bacterium]MBT3724776.1 type II toxin-antitoxin system VapC family toxin [Gammaproteobacteria bacterium]MBT4075920.1 type II toxin-antitoxin system VapC family toxin [Gammaproteobacteria bacterium]MBT4196582.1 type II toxin-antitoxin system VapC family toxin [Gammaproteobacteria bacterium]MBT4449314.1 type II toxin-antitoxin system VapC family toxin [Gammaproteobacteria bacterium]